MIRVLHIVPTLDRGGAEKQLVLLASGLPRDDFDVHVATLGSGGPLAETLTAADIPLAEIGQRWKFDPLAFRRLRKFIRNLQPDIVHTWLFAANCYGRKAALAERVKGIVASEQRVDIRKPWRRLVLDRTLAKRTDRIVTNAECVREFYVKHRISADKFTVIPNGVRKFEPAAKASRDEVLRELGLPSDARLIASIGRLEPYKRVKDLLWAADLLKVVREDAHFLIIGEGPHRPRLERFREQIEVSSRAHFLGRRDDVGRLLPHLDCFWVASSFEGQSNAIMEAVAAGVPVVASDIPGNRTLVVPGETGYLVPLGDRAAYARWTNHLLDNPSIAASFGENGRDRMLSEFPVEQMVQRYADLYEGLMQR